MEIIGTKYKPGAVVLLAFENDLPVFGCIKEIISIEGGVYLVLSLLHTGSVQ